MNRLLSHLSCASALALAMAVSGHAQAQTEVDVAMIGEPDTFDPMVSTKDIVSIVT